MRLIHTTTLEFAEFIEDHIPPYAILSHTWSNEEITLKQACERTPAIESRSGWIKIEKTCNQARMDGLDYAWIDTCCIDKTNSAELSESINSMFKWYERSIICYSFLVDVPRRDDWHRGTPHGSFAASRWFTRGWTLQELIAPPKMVFYDSSWSVIGSRDQMAAVISAITAIDKAFLGYRVSETPKSSPRTQTEVSPVKLWDLVDGSKGSMVRDRWLSSRLNRVSVAERMSWAARRKTTRIEDIAYCLLGIFGISMPLIYGEGAAAFIRLQEEILRLSDDYSILAWNFMHKGVPLPVHTWDNEFGYLSSRTRLRRLTPSKMGPDCPSVGLLAESPASFLGCDDIMPWEVDHVGGVASLTNKGLHATLPLSEDEPPYMLLPCRRKSDPRYMVAIPVIKREGNIYARAVWPHKLVSHNFWPCWVPTPMHLLTRPHIYDNRTRYSDYSFWIRELPPGYQVADAHPRDCWSQSTGMLTPYPTLEKTPLGETARVYLLLKGDQATKDLFIILEVRRLYQDGMWWLKPVMSGHAIMPYPAGQAAAALALAFSGDFPVELFQYDRNENGLVFVDIGYEHWLGRPMLIVAVKLDEGTSFSASWRRYGYDLKACVRGRLNDVIKRCRYLSALLDHLGRMALHWESNIRQLGYVLLAGNVAVLLVVQSLFPSAESPESTHPVDSRLSIPYFPVCFWLICGGFYYFLEHCVRLRSFPRFFRHLKAVSLLGFHTFVYWKVAVALDLDLNEVAVEGLAIVSLCTFFVCLVQRLFHIHL